MSSKYGPKIVTDGLIFHLDASDVKSYAGTGDVYTDLTGSGYYGKIVNGSSFLTDNYGIFSFDGTNDHIQIYGTPNNSPFCWTADNSVGSDIFFWEFWIKTTDTAGTILSKAWNGNGRYNIGVGVGSFQLTVNNSSTSDGDTVKYHTYNRTIANGEWTHLVVWADSTNMGSYINAGNENTTAHNHTGGVSYYGNGNIRMCIASLLPYSPWAGNTAWSVECKIGSIKRYNRVLSQKEIQQNYNATKGRFGL